MAMDLKWLLSADDKATPVFEHIKGSATTAAAGVEGAFTGAMGKFNLLTGAVGGMMAIAMGGAFSKVIKETVAWTGEAVALSKALGITTQQASVLNLALGDVYLTKETMLAGAGRIAKTLKTEEEAFQKLGVATRDQTGHYRSTLDIMTDVNTKLGTLKEGTDRNIAGMSIYGKSWSELSGLLKLNSEAMKDAEEKAKRLGLEVGDESVKNAKKYKAALNDIEDVAKSLAVRFGNVLLPALVKIGAFLGNNGPVLADAFKWSLMALGKTVTTLGEWIGLMAYRAVALGSILGSVLTGNFSAAATELRNMTAAGDDFNKRTKEKWADWSDKPIVSKAKEGDLLDTDFIKKDNSAVIKLWTDKAKSILEIEKERISTLLTMEKEYLAKLKTEYENHVKTLDTFEAAYTKVKDSIAARNKKDAEDRSAALRGAEDDYQKYYRTLAESKSREIALDNDGSWSAESIAKKLEGYSAELDLIAKIREESKTTNIANVSEYQIEADYQARKVQLEEKIVALGDKESAKLTENAVKAAEAVTLMEKAVKVQEDQVRILDHMIKNIPNITEKQINLKINGLQDLYRVQELMTGSAATTGAQYYGDYYTMGGKTYWADGTLADEGTSYAMPSYAVGTPYVPSDGPAYLHKGEAVIPAGQNVGGMNISGGITFSLPNVTNQTTARELARMVMPELQQLQSRFRTA